MLKDHLPGMQLTDFLPRLGDAEQSVCALADASGKGWGTMLAWNPAATLSAKGDKKAELQKFVSEQTKHQRYVAGYLSYDLGSLLHKAALHNSDDLKLPDAYVVAFDNYVLFDGKGATVCGSNKSFKEEVRAILARKAQIFSGPLYSVQLKPTQPRSTYESAYRRVQHHIVEGDVYQINLTHQLVGQTKASGRQFFNAVARRSQTGFQAYLEGPGFEIISASPERFISVNKQNIDSFPIKGTRPRGQSVEQDQALQLELRSSEKDKAELNMITDLIRNDLGAICQVGTVKVEAERIITGYPTIWHASSHISGKLREDVDSLGALLAMLPGGSVTGCPKKRAMEITDELENYRRGVYTGSIFCLRPGGSLDSNIAIRTLIKKQNQVYLSVGGGVVYDSNEAAEYQESLDKAAFFLNLGNNHD